MGTTVQHSTNHSTFGRASRVTRLLAALVASVLAGAGALSVAAPPAAAAIANGNSTTALSSGASGNASTTLTITRPASVAVGDLLLAQIAFEKGSGAGSNATITPAGWTLVNRQNQSSVIGQAIFYRVATAADTATPAPTYTWTFSQAVKALGGITRYTGVDTANPIADFSANSAASGQIRAQQVNPSMADARLVAFFFHEPKDPALPVPAGMTQRYDARNPNDGTSTPYTGTSFTDTHTYAAGTFVVTVTSGDEDGGIGVPVTTSFGNLYTASALRPPVQADGNGTHKLGSTIPLKIAVTDCEGVAVTNISPIVGLERVAPTQSTVEGVVSSSSADTGQTMRVTGQEYHYNLSTKRSALNANQDLTAGWYHVTVSSPALATVHGFFNLKP